MLYRTYLTYTISEPTQFWVPNNGVHDRAYVMVDGVRNLTSGYLVNAFFLFPSTP